MDTNTLRTKCDKLVEEFASKLGCLYPVERIDGKKMTCWTITLQAIKIEFRYIVSSAIGIPNSSLVCGIYLEKNSEYPYTINQVIDYLGIDDFHCYSFGLIENKKRMEYCFKEIASFITNNLESINELATSDFKYKQKRYNEFKRIMKTSKEELDDYVYSYLFDNQASRYIDFPAYNSFLKGDYKHALKQYNKLKEKNKCYDYELKLIAFIEDLVETGKEYDAIKLECYSMNEAKNYNGTSKKDLLAVAISIMIAYCITIIPFLLLTGISYYLQAKDSLFFYLTENIAIAFIWNIVLAIFAGLGFADEIRLLISKNKKKATDFTEVLTPKKDKKIVKITTILVFSFFILFYLFITKVNVKCYDEYMLCNASEGDFSQDFERFNYDDITEIYYVDKVYNKYSDKLIERNAYVLKFKNGYVNTDDYLTIYEVEETLLPIIQKYYDGDIKHKTSDLEIEMHP